VSRPSIDAWGLALARVVATRSTCLRRAVGAVLVDARGRVLATGYNGVAAGQPHCNEPDLLACEDCDEPLDASNFCLHCDHLNVGNVGGYPNVCRGARAASGTELDACEAIHAEANALLQCRDVDAVRTVYVTASPCVGCAKLLLATGAERIVFAEEYPAPAARELWERAGRTWCGPFLLEKS
jgi:dCMP deaminase